MTKTRVIRVFSFIMALTFVFAMLSVPSYAISPRQFGAWVASALTAINIVGQSTIGPAIQFGNQLNDYLSAPFKIEASQVVDVPYTWSDTEIEEYLLQSTISFSGEDVVIDGKHYQDVWLSNEAAEKFRVNAFDIQSAFNIASNSNGTYVSGIGNLYGVPLFQDNNSNTFSQNYLVSGSSSIGQFVVQAGMGGTNPPVNGYTWCDTTYPDGSKWVSGAMPPKQNGLPVIWLLKNKHIYLTTNSSYSKNTDIQGVWDAHFVNEPFDFDWVAGTIPADEQLASTDGLHMYVPTDPSEWTDNPDVQNVINNYNTYKENNPDITPGVDLDLNTSGLLDKVGNILEILGPIVDLLKSDFGPKSEDPDPPVPPVPGDTISEAPWSSLSDLLERILNKLNDILGIRDIISNFKTAFDNAISAIETIISSIKSVLDSILDALSNLADSIVNGNADWFSDIVDAIKTPFLSWLNILKAATGIWRYVVLWVQNISAPFGYFINILVNVNSTFLSPFYAVAAAAIVIAIYRRFGR